MLKMTESPSESVPESRIIDNNENNHHSSLPEIPIDIVSEEEMGLLEAALALARFSFTSSVIAPAIRSTTFKATLGPFNQLRKKKGLSVTDVTVTVVKHASGASQRGVAQNQVFGVRMAFPEERGGLHWCFPQLETHHQGDRQDSLTFWKVGIPYLHQPGDMREGLGIALAKARPLEVVLAPRLPLQLYECL
ncbi:hypothetical protein FNV43_RR04319 [Rhamnella rubrinervis]|uniref:Uncharacterized protein n=1 Tax=Rhamnella rubrinervis TaxID=2594499 RepID=A0A8K0MQ46_9ROSA|nr:hypothetical protein FNV43_RR04319 [Rhamnella rubrinervis]